jgi:hypothetical protein
VQLIVTLGLSALGLAVAVCLVSAHTASPVALEFEAEHSGANVHFPEVCVRGAGPHVPPVVSMPGCGCASVMCSVLTLLPRHGQASEDPQHPPMSDHTNFGVGNEDRIERRANWALRVIGQVIYVF